MVFNDKKMFEVIDECYRRIYRECEPMGDIDKIKKSGEGRMPEFFMAYYLDQDRQDEITKEVIKELKVPKIQISKVHTSVMLGASPCGNKETSVEYRKTHNKRLKKHLARLNDAYEKEDVNVLLDESGGKE